MSVNVEKSIYMLNVNKQTYEMGQLTFECIVMV